MNNSNKLGSVSIQLIVLAVSHSCGLRQGWRLMFHPPASVSLDAFLPVASQAQWEVGLPARPSQVKLGERLEDARTCLNTLSVFCLLFPPILSKLSTKWPFVNNNKINKLGSH